MFKKIILNTRVLKRTEIVIGRGLQKQLSLYIRNFHPSKIVYITDRALYLKLKQYAPEVGKNVFLLNASEVEKNWKNLEKILHFFFVNNIDKKSLVIVFGGGMVTDIAGFASSIFYRGVPAIFIPTTLLAQIDASTGGKNTINFKNTKNVLGTIYQPKLILVDINLLKTLPKRQFISGMGEVIKYGAGFDKKLFNQILLGNISGKKGILSIIQRCIEIKADIVQRDSDESRGIRKLLNLGHTLGQALESEKGFGLGHGEAVAIGLEFAAFISNRIGTLPEDQFKQILFAMRKYNLPPRISLDVEKIINKIQYDKKRSSNYIEFVLIKEIGKSFIQKLTFDTLKAYLCKFKALD